MLTEKEGQANGVEGRLCWQKGTNRPLVENGRLVFSPKG